MVIYCPKCENTRVYHVMGDRWRCPKCETPFSAHDIPENQPQPGELAGATGQPERAEDLADANRQD